MMTTFMTLACLKDLVRVLLFLGYQYPHEYDPEILAEVDNDTSEATDDYLYDFSLSQLPRDKGNPQDINNAMRTHMQKATRYFELKKNLRSV